MNGKGTYVKNLSQTCGRSNTSINTLDWKIYLFCEKSWLIKQQRNMPVQMSTRKW